MKFLSFLAMTLGFMAVAASEDKYVFERLDKNDALLLVVDLQVGLYNLARDFDPTLYRDQILAHAALGKVFDLPVILTTSADNGPNGPLPKEILEMYPDAPLVHRQGEVDAWDNQKFRDAVKAANKSQIIMAGITTDVCTTFLALSLREEGYSVWANVEASGTTSRLVRDISNDRMAKAGVHTVSLFSIACDLMRDWRNTPGAKEMIPWLDKYFPVWGYVARAHEAAVNNGTIQPEQIAEILLMKHLERGCLAFKLTSLRPTEARKNSGSGSGSSDGRAMLQKALDLLAESRRETKMLQEGLKEQMEMTMELREAVAKQEEIVHEMGKQMMEIKDQMTEELQRAREQLETIATNATDGPQRSYADVTRLTPFLPRNDSRTLAAPPNLTDVLYCTIDVSRLEEDEARLSAGTIRTTVENEVRSELDNPTWRCRSVTSDPKNPHRIRITCRDESEHEIVKRIAETKLAPGPRILRDDLYPIRVDNVSRIAVLNERNEVRTEVTEMLGRENDTEVGKIAWLSKRDVPKAYDSMVVYLKKRSEARRFINEGFFVAGGESGTTKAFERRDRPKQCYNCQQITSHKAY
ncbi:hypothetical protein FOXB_01736, partial [Fusarium oxysporum f. sp. conglutinans Fo5176]